MTEEEMLEEKAKMYEERRAEKNRQRKGELSYRRVHYTYGCPIVKLENRAFGWHYEGRDIQKVDQGYEVNAFGTGLNHKVKIIKSAYFSRPKIWPRNFLTVLTETLSRIVSFFRCLALSLIWIPILVYIGMIFWGSAQTTIDNFKITVLGVYIGLIAGSLVLAGLGFLWRKVFKLREKCDAELEKNGFIAWSETDEGEHF